MTDNANVNANVNIKHLTCSMTRANKILTAIRETKPATKKDRYSLYKDPTSYGIKITLASYSDADVKSKLDNIKEKFTEETIRRRLVAKLKNRLFSLNVRYGINDIMTEIELLRAERQKLNDIIEDYNKHTYLDYKDLKSKMDLFKNADHKYDLSWEVGAFDIGDFKNQVKALTKRIGVLDEKRDQINIQNSFTIDLTPEEYSMLDLD